MAKSYLVVVSFCESAAAKFARVSPSRLERWIVVSVDVLFQVASLSKTFRTKLTDERLDTSMHPDVVEQVPGSEELFASALVSANVNDDWFAALRTLTILAVVGILFQLL